ncbi:MAG: hypothetical protein IJS17_02025 [Clostridia bacterium]|nr:hypothetical protein [Clostridia bacterium]
MTFFDFDWNCDGNIDEKDQILDDIFLLSAVLDDEEKSLDDEDEDDFDLFSDDFSDGFDDF